jgi:tetratricopeptide (TPR) repeat protein
MSRNTEIIKQYPRTASARLKAISVVLVLLALVAVLPGFSQAKFYASAPKSVPQNANFQLSFTIENANGTNLRPPSVPDFQVMGGPQTSTSMQWVNGNVTQSVTYIYVLRPKNQGTFKIGKASIQVAGATMESNELSVTVTAPVAQQQTQRQRNPFDPFDDPFFNGGEEEEEQPQAPTGDLEKQLKDDVFVRLSVNKNSAYKGEMLTATYKLYFRQNLAGINVSKAPAFDGFWSQEIELDPHRRPATETINGKQYNVVEVLKYNLYPQRAGSLPVASCEVNTVVQVQVRSRSRNFFDSFFGQVQQVPMKLTASGATVAVKELPESGKPADFAGAVGKYKFETSLSGKEAKTDEPITYTLKISGTGNLKFVDAPPLTFPEEFEVYDPKTKENISNGPEGLSGTKQYDYLIIPRQPGDYKIEAKTFSWFDPSAGKYFTTNSPEFAVKVTGEPSKNLNTAAAAGTGRQEVSLVGQDIRYIKTKSPEFKKGEAFFGSAGFVAMYASPFLLFIGLIAVKRRNETMAADVIGTKRRRALKQAKKRLSIAEKNLAKGDKKGFYDEVSRAIWGYLGDKLNIDMAELSKDNVEEKLLAKSAKPETIAKLKGLLGVCEMALYSPIGEGSEMKVNYDVAMNLMADLEDEVKETAPKSDKPVNPFLSSLIIGFLMLAFSASAVAQTAGDLYQKANAAYKAGNFEQAANTYENILAQGYRTPEVYYNLGNSYYKLKNNGRAILNFERAQKLAPADEDIAHNLKLAQFKAVDKLVPVPQLAIAATFNKFTGSQSSKGWGLFAVAAVWLALIAFAAYLFVSRSKIVVFMASVFLLVSVAFIALGFKQSGEEENSCNAILMADNVTVKSAPDLNGTDLFAIHEGIKMQVLDQVGNWNKIRLADGKVGWIEKGLFEKI